MNFFDAYAKHESAALATEDGKAFTAAGFTFWHTGGGCTAWQRDVGSSGWYLLITDSSGCDAMLDPMQEDHWLVGAHGPDGEFSECEYAQTAAEAIAAAAAMQERVLGGSITLEG